MIRAALLALSLLPFAATGGEVSAEVGQCRFATVENGTFYQANQHTENFMHPACWSLGLSDKWQRDSRFGWAVRVLATDTIQARGNVAINDEEVAAPPTCNPGATGESGCHARFNGQGSTQGISFGLTVEQPLTSHLSVVGEWGLFFFQHHFKAEARFVDCPACTRQISFNESSRIWDEPVPLVGVTLRYRRVYVALRHYWPGAHRALSLTDHSFTQWSAGAIVWEW